MDDRSVRLTTEKQALKKVSRDLVCAAGGQEAASAYTERRLRQQAISDRVSPNVNRFLPIDVVEDLESVTQGAPGWPIVTRHLAARQGFILVREPKGDAGDADWHAEIARLIKEHAELSAGLLTSLADGRVTAAEIRKLNLIGEATDLMTVVAQLVAMLDRAAQEE